MRKKLLSNESQGRSCVSGHHCSSILQKEDSKGWRATPVRTPAAMKMCSEVTEKSCFPGPAQRAVEYLSCFHCSGWCPFVMDHGLLRVLSKCGHQRGTFSADKGNPKGNNSGREGGCQRHHRRVHQDSKPVSPFCVFTFVWGCHTESPANSLAGFSQRSARGPGATDYQFWGWCPLQLREPVQCGRRLGEFSSISARR